MSHTPKSPAEGLPSRDAGGSPESDGSPLTDGSFENAPIAIHWADANGVVLRANRAELELLGYAPEEYVGHPVREFHADPGVADAIFARLAKGETVRDQAGRLRCKDGSVKDVRIGYDVLQVDGRLVYARCFTQDVSESVRLEHALRENEERFRLMVEGIRDYAIHTVGPDGKITSWNSGAERLHGFSTDEVVGSDLSVLYLPADRASRLPERLLREAVEKGESHQEGWRLRKDGSRFWADSVLTALRDEHGRLRGFTRLARDVTSRMVTEVTRRRSAELEAENRRLVDAWRLQAEFLGSMSRELRSPLGAALAAAERLREAEDGPLTDEQQAHVDDVWSGLRHVLRAFDEVFDVVRLESGRLQLRPQRVSLGRLVQDAREVLRSHAAEKRVSIELELDPAGPAEIEGDPALLKLVVHNLLWAAIRSAWPDGLVPVYVMPEGPDAFRIEVVDDGLDRPADEPGSDGSRSSEDDASGLAGLRLAVTGRIVEAHGGRVGTREAPGGGRVHFVVLPRVARPAAPTDEPAGDAALTQPAPGERTILVIEDEAASRAWLTWTLSSEGWNVVTAGSADEALAFSRARTFDAVAVDLLLEGGTAPDVVRRMRAEGLNRTLDVLLATVPGEAEGVAGVAVDDVLVRPVRTEALFAALDRAGVARHGASPVLVLDADDADREAALASLRVLGYDAAGAADAEAGLRTAAETQPGAILLSIDAATGGLEFLRHFRRTQRGSTIPAFLLAPSHSTPHGVRAVRTTAQAHVLTCPGGRARLLQELDARLARPRERA